MIKEKIIKPVGAITSQSYAFKNRNWKAWSLSTYSIFDPLMLPIKVDLKGSQIVRILPKNDAFSIWISDKVRFAFDGLERHRFVSPMFLKKSFYTEKNSSYLNVLKVNFLPVSWSFSFNLLSKYHNFLESGKLESLNTFLGPFSDTYSAAFTKKFTNRLGYSNVFLNSNTDYPNFDYLNTFDLNKLKSTKSLFFVGSNLRLENPTLNFFINQFSKSKKILLICIGSLNNSLISRFFHLNNGMKSLLNVFEGKNQVCRFLSKNNKYFNSTTFIFGSDFISRSDFSKFYNHFNKSINIFSNLFSNIEFTFLNSEISYYNSSLVGAGVSTPRKKDMNVFRNSLNYFIGTHNTSHLFNISSRKKEDNSFSAFLGHHNNNYLENLDVVLPTFHFFEKDYKSSFYVNMFSKYYKNVGTVTSRNSVNFKYDWLILACLLYKSQNLNFDSCLNILKSENVNLFSFDKYKLNFKFYNFKFKPSNFKFKYYLNFMKSSVNIYNSQNADAAVFNSKVLLNKFNKTKVMFNKNNYYKFN